MKAGLVALAMILYVADRQLTLYQRTHARVDDDAVPDLVSPIGFYVPEGLPDRFDEYPDEDI